MNRTRIEQLIAKIETLPHEVVRPTSDESFDMSRYRYSCGSPACIAGWAVYLFGPGHKRLAGESTSTFAAELLDIDPKWAGEQVFDPDINLYAATPQDAANALRALLEYGEAATEEQLWGRLLT